MQIGAYKFSPSWFPSLVTLLVLALLLHLGTWQWNKGELKDAMVANHAELTSRSPVAIETISDTPEEARHQNVTANGFYLGGQQFLLDNRTHNHRAGYHVISPFKLQSNQQVILVNRGWVPVGASRDSLPDVNVADIQRLIVGRLNVIHSNAFILGEAGYTVAGFPKVVQRREPQSISKILSAQVLPYILRLDRADQDGFIREWPAHWGISAERHRGYSVQWFSLAAALCVIYIVVNLKRARS